MERQKKEPELHNEELGKAIEEFKKKQTNENMVKIMQRLEKATVMQPAFLPAGTDKEDIRKMIQQSQGGKVPLKLNAQSRPRPVVLKNDKGEQFFAVFTGKEHVPAGQKYPAMMFLPFIECSKMAARAELQLKGIVVNPFTDNLTLNKPALDLMNNKAAKQGAPALIPIGDRIIQTFLPGKFHQDKQGFMQKISQEKEEYVAELFCEAFKSLKGDNAACPYQKKDFELMVLNFSDTLQMARIGLAEGGAVKSQCISAFCFYNPKTGEDIYYLIKKGAKGSPNLLLSVDEKGSISELGDAPAEGSELYGLVGRVPWEAGNQL